MTKIHNPKALILLVFAFVLGFARPLPARAATLTVSDCSAPSGAAGRLVDVINAATWGDTISFSCSGTITLSSTITLDKNLTINGTGQSVTISGGGAVRVFYVQGQNPDVAVTLNHLTITNGFADQGAGIFNVNVLLTVTNSTLSGNHATQFGGGIFNETNGRLDVTNSTLWGNSAIYDGGGINNFFGRVWVTNSTLSGNSANNGGGIANRFGTVIASNSTMSGNTVTGNGGSIYNFGTGATFNFYSTILANTPGNLDCANAGGAQIGNNDYNLVEDGSCSSAGVYFKTGDPRLGPLADNGGATWTMALAPGSPAIDAGYDLICELSPVYNLDQRGIVRPQGAHCDIGAYESRGFTLAKSDGDNQSTPINTAFTNPLSVTLSETGGSGLPGVVVTFTAPSSGASANLSSPTATTDSSGNASVNATANGTVGGPYNVTASATGATSVNFALTNTCANAITVISNADSGAGSLRQAIADVCAGGTVTFNANYTITLTSGELAIAKNLTIDGSGHQIAVSGNNATRVFNIGGGNVILNALNIINGNGNNDLGGGIVNWATLTINNSTFADNHADSSGGGAIRNGGTLNVNNSTFANNTAGVEGGGISNYGTLNADNSTFSGNRAVNSIGGGIYNNNIATLHNTIVAASPAGGNCGGNAFAAGSASNLSDDATCSGGFTQSASLALGSLGNYGGDTPTIPLLPGSSAIDAGAACLATDQRGAARVGACDVGAFESQGFTLTKNGGDNQSTPINTAFTNPFNVTLSETGGSGLPGVVITFTAPSSGASAHLSSPTATTDSSGNASVNATANGTVGGPYNVTASATGATSVNFALTNTCANAITVISNADSGAGSLRQAIADVCAGGTITFNANYTITLSSGELAIAKNLTIDGSGHQITVSGNNATRVFNVTAGNVTLKALNIINGGGGGNGGGIWNEATLLVTDSTFSGNAGYGGGAIRNSGGTLTVINSTFSGNTAAVEGGGISNYGTLNVNNSTFSGNRAVNSIGGGIYNNNIATLHNTIVAASPAGGNCGGNAFAAGSASNLSDDATCSGGFTQSASLALGSLGNYGGDTPTIPLLPGSTALDAGVACPATDQRGVARPQGAGCDIGAFEYIGSSAAASISGNNLRLTWVLHPGITYQVWRSTTTPYFTPGGSGAEAPASITCTPAGGTMMCTDVNALILSAANYYVVRATYPASGAFDDLNRLGTFSYSMSIAP